MAVSDDRDLYPLPTFPFCFDLSLNLFADSRFLLPSGDVFHG